MVALFSFLVSASGKTDCYRLHHPTLQSYFTPLEQMLRYYFGAVAQVLFGAETQVLFRLLFSIAGDKLQGKQGGENR